MGSQVGLPVSTFRPLEKGEERENPPDSECIKPATRDGIVFLLANLIVITLARCLFAMHDSILGCRKSQHESRLLTERLHAIGPSDGLGHGACMLSQDAGTDKSTPLERLSGHGSWMDAPWERLSVSDGAARPPSTRA